MSKTIEVKVIELPKDELKPGSKYLFIVSPEVPFIEELENELERLIGRDNFTLFPMPLGLIKAYSIPQEATDATTT
jgi:hypothetical protein